MERLDESDDDVEETSSHPKKLTKESILVIIVVFLCLFVDSLLLTCVVPVLPAYIRETSPAPDQVQDHNQTETQSTRQSMLKHIFVLVKENNDLINENERIGFLFSSKAIVQLVVNPLVALAMSKKGCKTVLLSGLCIQLASTLLYGVSTSYIFLMVGRAIHGISASCVSICGITLMAYTFQTEETRSWVMGMTLGGQALGVVVGYPFGGFSFHFGGKAAVFVPIAVLVFVTIILAYTGVEESSEQKQREKHSASSREILRDPYVLLASCCLMLPELSMALLEPTLPIWLSSNLHLEKWQIGLVFLPDSFGFLLGTNLFGVAGLKLGRWICILCSLVLVGVCLVLVRCCCSEYNSGGHRFTDELIN